MIWGVLLGVLVSISLGIQIIEWNDPGIMDSVVERLCDAMSPITKPIKQWLYDTGKPIADFWFNRGRRK